MDKKCVLMLSVAVMLSSVSASAIEVNDTLLSADKAGEVDIFSNGKRASVTVKKVDGTADNFYYATGNSDKDLFYAMTTITAHDVSNIVIVDFGKGVKVEYNDNDNNQQVYTFSSPDPDNRWIKSFTGRKRPGDMGLTIRDSGRTQWEAIMTGPGIGWVAPLGASQPMATSMGRSCELTWSMILGVRMKHGRHRLEMGLGLDWRNYVTRSDRYFELMPDRSIAMLPYSDAMATKTRSRIKVFSLQVPLLYTVMDNRNEFGFSIGPVINFNTYGSIKTSYTVGDRDYTVYTHNIGQRPVTVDAMAVVRYDCLGLYVRYAPMDMLRSRTNLGFKTLSTGLMLLF